MEKEKATNFSEELLPELRAVLDFAVSSDRSDFYRRRFPAGTPRPASYGEFAALPLLEKGDLSAVPWRSRLFVPESELGAFGISSGTTGRPLVIPRLPQPWGVVNEKDLSPLGVDRVLLLMPPFAGVARHLANNCPGGIFVLPGDVRNMDLTASVAHEVGVNGMVTTYSGLDRFIEACDRLGLGLDGIGWVSVGGEAVSEARWARMRSRLPGARLAPRFNSSEFGTLRFYRCGRLADAPPDHFHPIPGSHLFEILTPSGAAAAPGETGELVHTDLGLPRAFPFIRYRTGDGAALLPSPCGCGNPHLLRLSGKLGFGSLKYAGISLREDMVELALERVSDLVEKDFRLHLREETSAGGLVPALELQLLPRDRRVLGPAREELEGRLAAVVAAALHVSASRTLADLEKEGRFRPLKVSLVDAFPPADGKAPRLVSHV